MTPTSATRAWIVVTPTQYARASRKLRDALDEIARRLAAKAAAKAVN